MLFHVTSVFARSYDALDEEDAFVVDQVITRIVAEHDRAWARQNRVVGEEGEAWIVPGRSRRSEFRVYWTYLDDDVIVFLALLYV